MVDGDRCPQQGGEQGAIHLEQLCKTYWNRLIIMRAAVAWIITQHGLCAGIPYPHAGWRLASVRLIKNVVVFAVVINGAAALGKSPACAHGAERITMVNDELVRAYDREDDQSSPEDLFNKAWASSCLDEALRLMVEDHGRGRRKHQVAVFEKYLELTAEGGDTPSYDTLAEEFVVPVTTVTNDLHRARSLFKTYLLRVIRETVERPEDAEIELHALRQYLGR